MLKDAIRNFKDLTERKWEFILGDMATFYYFSKLNSDSITCDTLLFFNPWEKILIFMFILYQNICGWFSEGATLMINWCVQVFDWEHFSYSTRAIFWLFKLVSSAVCTAYLSLSMSLTFLFAKHCLSITSRVDALEGVSPPENRSARGRRRTRHRWSFGSWGEDKGKCYIKYISQSNLTNYQYCAYSLPYHASLVNYVRSWWHHKWLPRLLRTQK